jgi:hypothetical protein
MIKIKISEVKKMRYDEILVADYAKVHGSLCVLREDEMC